MRVQAIRVSETLYKAGNRTFADDYRALTKDSDPDVAVQALLTSNLFRLPNIEALITETQAANDARGIQEIGKQLLQRIENAAKTAALGFSPEEQEQMKEGETVYKSLCSACHGEDGRGVPLAGATNGADDGAGAGRLATRAGSSRLRHQDPAARHDRPARRPDVHPGHAADGRAERSVDRQRRLVHPPRFRQHRYPSSRRRKSLACGRPQQAGRPCGRSRSSTRRCPGSFRPSPPGRRRQATTPSAPATA